jgi:hypothetical protein
VDTLSVFHTALTDPMTAALESRHSVWFVITPLVPTTIGRTTGYPLCFAQSSAKSRSSLNFARQAVVATYGELYKRGRPIRELQDQVRVVVFHRVDSLHPRIPQESPFFAVAFKSELPLRRFRPVSAFLRLKNIITQTVIRGPSS